MVLAQLGTDLCSYDTIGTTDKFGGMKAGESVNDSYVLFARIDEAVLMKQINEYMEEQKREAAADAPVEKPEGLALIGIDDFMKVELRSAKIIDCEPVKKAKKLLKLTIDLGYEKRTVASGIAKFYKPEDLIGKKIILVTNLKPAVLCGIESEGMILASGEETVRVVFLSDDTPLGERIR